jgi:hypothetical protein
VDPKRDRGIVPVAKLSKSGGMAVVGSWEATDPDGQLQRLAMMTDGRFVPATDLEAASPSRFEGAVLDDDVKLPLAYVVKRGVRAWAVDGSKAEKRARLDYHQRFNLTGKYRTLEGLRFWETDTGAWVRHKDVTVIRRRNKAPDFVTPDTKWMDISVVTNTLVLYEGNNAVFATLVSTGRDRLGDPETTASTPMGEFHVVAKQVTGANLDSKALSSGADLFDVPWVLELENGKHVLASYWHDRFGIEDGPGDIELSPADAAHVWAWTDPQLPAGWHGITLPAAEQTVIVNVRK